MAHYHGQTINYHKLAAAIDISIPTLKKYLVVLERTCMVRLLPPFWVIAPVNEPYKIQKGVFVCSSGHLNLE